VDKQPHFFGNIFLKNPNYHIADYNLYYLSVRENHSKESMRFGRDSFVAKLQHFMAASLLPVHPGVIARVYFWLVWLQKEKCNIAQYDF
jgi:hypothetical protein